MVDDGIIALLSQLSGKCQPKLRGSLLHPKDLLGRFDCHFLIMSLSMAVLLDHFALSQRRQAATATAVAVLPPTPPPCCRHRQAAAAATAAALLPPPPPRFRLRRRLRCAAAKLPPSPSFLSSLLSLSSLPFPTPLPPTNLVNC